MQLRYLHGLTQDETVERFPYCYAQMLSIPLQDAIDRYQPCLDSIKNWERDALDKLCAMESAQKDAVIAQQGQRIAALEADARMCGVVRYPTASTYAVNCNPFFSGYSCGCANI